MDILGSKKQSLNIYSLKQNGFSLIEILLSVSIIALLVVVGMWAYKEQLWKGWDSRRKSDIYLIKTAVEEYEKDNDCYPASLPACDTEGEDNFLSAYLPRIPCDPQTKKDYVYTPQGSTSCPKWYWAFTTFSNKSDPAIADLGCGEGCGPTEATAVFDYYQTSPNAPEPVKNAGVLTPPSGSVPSELYYGCVSGICTPIDWDYSLPGPECVPNYTTRDCAGLCVGENGLPRNECEK